MIDAAVAFLASAQDERGAWSDFDLPAGASDLWVTGYVGEAIAPFAPRAAQRAWTFLRDTKREGWSYNARVPCDGDSTLWALRLGRALGEDDAEARSFLETHVTGDGGVSTYAGPDAVRKYVGVPPFVRFDGWTQSHICVTAACANLIRGRFDDWLLARQEGDGRWRAYWWMDDEYATSEAVAAIGDDAAKTRAAAWAETRTEQASAFALAGLLRILLSNKERALERLAALQRDDGSFPPSARLRVPRPDTVTPDEQRPWKPWSGMPDGPVTVAALLQHTFDIYSLDQRGLFTTAAVVRALAARS